MKGLPERVLVDDRRQVWRCSRGVDVVNLVVVGPVGEGRRKEIWSFRKAEEIFSMSDRQTSRGSYFVRTGGPTTSD